MDLRLLFVLRVCLCHTILSAPGSLVVTYCERAYRLCVMFSCVFVNFLYGVMGQVWYLIVTIPDRWLRPYVDC